MQHVAHRPSPVARLFVRCCFALAVCAAALHWPLSATAATAPIVTDSRIKTFVYNPNEVFSITTHYGYQSNIEFGDKEIIDTVSVGDRVGWQIIPSGRRLFIRAMEENAHTNMTIVTNLHAYQFDLRSSASNATFGSQELTYVVRFYYPEPSSNRVAEAAPDFVPHMAAPAAPQPVVTAPPPAEPIITAPVPPPSVVVPAPTPTVVAPAGPSVAVPVPSVRKDYNYRYTYSGASQIAPTKIYDDGASTYFRLPGALLPKISMVNDRGGRVELPVRQLPNHVIAVDRIARMFTISLPAGQVTVYNESGGV